MQSVNSADPEDVAIQHQRAYFFVGHIGADFHVAGFFIKRIEAVVGAQKYSRVLFGNRVYMSAVKHFGTHTVSGNTIVIRQSVVGTDPRKSVTVAIDAIYSGLTTVHNDILPGKGRIGGVCRRQTHPEECE